ncbi:hypothetical protein AN958_07451 [Leucoagaricus sp. SymC.cos]|nr:hypothetical protein AN958_07451 [Leucoagaricus sp. SymC.cos]
MLLPPRSSPRASPAESQPNNNTPAAHSVGQPSPTNNVADTSQPSSTSPPPRMSKDSEGYPSWLPKRPPPPAPASTMHSSVGVPEADPDTDPELFASIGGRKPTPRSVRIVSLHGINPAERAQSAQRPDSSRPGPPAKAWSRGTAPSMPPGNEQGGFAYPYYTSMRIPQPKFNAKNLDLEAMVTPSILLRLYFFIFPILAFAHIPLQTYFDFNAVYMLIQVSKNPNPAAPGVPGSGRNWALAAAAYVACWLAWIICVFILYELAYSFIRRWRVKRPAMMPIYLSSPAHTFVSMTSYTNFRFLFYLRLQAWFGEHGSTRDGFAETFYWYSQNLPTVALLLPRAALSLALLFAFSSPQVGTLSLASMGINNRDPTFFRREDGTLTGYARGVLIANATWAAWRILVLLVSWMGLWILSDQGCAGLCGPRYRWEEEEMEKTRSSIYSTENDSNREIDALAWTWEECTRLRIQDSYELCLNTPNLRWGSSVSQEKGKEVAEPDQVEVQRVLAAVGIPSVPSPARRRVLTDDFFESPKDGKEIELRHRESDKGIGPSTLPYPFTQQGSAQVSSKDKVPFPPSPTKSKKTTSRSGTSHTTSESTSSTPTSSSSGSGSTENDNEEEDEEEGQDGFDTSEDRSAGHASNSLSSLGHPITPSRRYPFGFRHPGGRGNSTSSRSHQSRPSQSGVSQSGVSYSGISQSTGNRPSTDSPSDAAWSPDARPRASLSQSSGGSGAASGIPMPPRHPNPQSRTRAPAIPLPALPAATAVEFPSVRLRADSGILPGVTTIRAELMQDDAESISSSDSAGDEQQDEVGLLSPGASHTNLGVPVAPGSASSRSRTGSSARSRANSVRSQPSLPAIRSRVSSLGAAVRSRAQSMLQSVSATSLDVVRGATRSRTNSSMARLEEEAAHNLPELPSVARTRDVSGSTQGSSSQTQTTSYPYSFSNPQAWEDRGYVSSSSHSGSGSASGGENWTFGQPMPFMRPGQSHLRAEVHTDSDESKKSGGSGNGREEEESPVEEITREFGPARTPQLVHPTAQALVGPGMPGPGVSPMSASIETTGSSALEVYHSTHGSTGTVSPQEVQGDITITIDAGDAEPSTSAGPGIDIPWGRYRLQEPYGMHHRGHGVGDDEGDRSPSSSPPQASGRQPGMPQAMSSSMSGSPPDISTAAQSFVTVPATIEGTMTTESSEGRTERGSLNDESAWNLAPTSRGMRGAGIRNVGLGTGGMGPEREEPMGDWRVR